MTMPNAKDIIDSILDEFRQMLTTSDLETAIRMMERMLERERMPELDRRVISEEIADCRSEIARRGGVT